MRPSTIAQSILDTLARHGITSAYGFVNGKTVEQNPGSESILWKWLAQGYSLGNHTYSHLSLNKSTPEEFFADLERGEDILEKLDPDPRSWKVFRYPYLFEGNTLDKRRQVRRYLEQHYYTIAHVTIDADDWAYNPPFARCAEKHDNESLDTLHGLFVRGHLDELRRVRDLTQKTEHRDVPHVLLLHVGIADADALDSVLTVYEHEGAHWIDLRDALADPYYSFDPDLAATYGSAFPYRVAKAKGVTIEPSTFARGLEERLDAMCR